MIKNVVNLIPPPVEALPAPINIRSIINSREGFDKAEISTVLNPQCELKLHGNKQPFPLQRGKSSHRKGIVELEYKIKQSQ